MIAPIADGAGAARSAGTTARRELHKNTLQAHTVTMPSVERMDGPNRAVKAIERWKRGVVVNVIFVFG